MNQAFIDGLLARRSVRAFRPEQITDEELETVLACGSYAPTARGQMSPFMIAVQNKEDRDTVARLNAAVMGVDKDPYYGAPTIILVVAPRDNFADLNGAAICTNLLNAASALGLGSCWIHRSEAVFDGEEGKALLRKWGLPDDLKGVASVALGYAAVGAPAPAPRKPDYYRVIK